MPKRIAAEHKIDDSNNDPLDNTNGKPFYKKLKPTCLPTLPVIKLKRCKIITTKPPVCMGKKKISNASNKLYKVVSINGQIMLAEQDENDLGLNIENNVDNSLLKKEHNEDYSKEDEITLHFDTKSEGNLNISTSDKYNEEESSNQHKNILKLGPENVDKSNLVNSTVSEVAVDKDSSVTHDIDVQIKIEDNDAINLDNSIVDEENMDTTPREHEKTLDLNIQNDTDNNFDNSQNVCNRNKCEENNPKQNENISDLSTETDNEDNADNSLVEDDHSQNNTKRNENLIDLCNDSDDEKQFNNNNTELGQRRHDKHRKPVHEKPDKGINEKHVRVYAYQGKNQNPNPVKILNYSFTCSEPEDPCDSIKELTKSKLITKGSQNDLHFENPYPGIYVAHNQNKENVQIHSSKIPNSKPADKSTNQLQLVLDNSHSSKTIQPKLSLSYTSHKSTSANNNQQGLSKTVSDSSANTKQTNKPPINNIIEDFVDYFADIMNYKWYNDQDVLIYGKNGTAMALVHEAKYQANKTKIAELKESAEAIKRNNQILLDEKRQFQEYIKKYQDEIKRLKLEKDTIVKKLTDEIKLLQDTIDKMNDELIELKDFKESLSKLYSETQINFMLNPNKTKMAWSDEDMKKAVFLYQIISSKAYMYLKTMMKFPLPNKNSIQKWMSDRNISYTKKTKNKQSKEDQDANEAADKKMDTIEETLSADEYKTSIKNDNAINVITKDVKDFIKSDDNTEFSQEEIKTKEVDTETEHAVNMIIDNKNVVDGQRVLSEPAYPDGEMLLVYLDDNNVNENYVIDESFVDGEIYSQDVTADGINYDNVEFDANVDREANVDHDANASYETNIDHETNVGHEDNYHEVDEYHETYADNESNVEHEASGGNDNVNDANIEHESNTAIAGDNNDTSAGNNLELDFLYKGNRNTHIISRMLNWKRMCQLCMKFFETQEELREHVPIHYFNTYCTTYLDAQKPYQCEFCHEMVKQQTTLVRHHIMHLGITSYQCWHPGCTYTAKRKDTLTSHWPKHFPRSYVCPSCSARFTTRPALRDHYWRRHTADRTIHRCPLCRAISRSDFTFQLHMKSHEKPPTFKCNVAGCSEAFYSRSSLGKHKETHRGGAKPYKCPHCPLATYSHEFLLKKHLERHKKYQIAHCTRCHQIFDTFSEYYAHAKTHPPIVKLNKYTCVCKQGFTTKMSYQKHKSQCTLGGGSDKLKRNKRSRKINNNQGSVKSELKPAITLSDSSNQIAVYFDGKIIRTVPKNNKISDNNNEKNGTPQEERKRFIKTYTLKNINKYINSNKDLSKQNRSINIISNQRVIINDEKQIIKKDEAISGVNNGIEQPITTNQTDMPILDPVKTTIEYKPSVDSTDEISNVLGTSTESNYMEQLSVVSEETVVTSENNIDNSTMEQQINQSEDIIELKLPMLIPISESNSTSSQKSNGEPGTTVQRKICTVSKKKLLKKVPLKDIKMKNILNYLKDGKKYRIVAKDNSNEINTADKNVQDIDKNEEIQSEILTDRSQTSEHNQIDDNQSPDEIQKTEYILNTDNSTGKIDILGALMKKSECLDQPVIMEQNNFSSEKVTENTDQKKPMGLTLNILEGYLTENSDKQTDHNKINITNDDEVSSLSTPEGSQETIIKKVTPSTCQLDMPFIDQIEDPNHISSQILMKPQKCCKCKLSTDPNAVLYRFPNPKTESPLRCEKWAKYMFPERKCTSRLLHEKLYNDCWMLCDRHFLKPSFVDYTQRKLHRLAYPNQ